MVLSQAPVPLPVSLPRSPSLPVPLGPSEAFSDAPLQLLPLDSPITAFPSNRPVCNHGLTICSPRARPKSPDLLVRTVPEPAAHASLTQHSAAPPRSTQQVHPSYIHPPRGYLIRPELPSSTPIATRKLPSAFYPEQVKPRRASSTNPKERAYPQLQQGDQEAPCAGRRYPLLGLEVGHSCGTRKRSHPLPAFFPVSVPTLLGQGHHTGHPRKIRHSLKSRQGLPGDRE
ncbi:hypothetical protein CH63R_00842 [Colletotrichum higginsianum IMI 349063]|uniref:Uncharacterized protein n=1 Tax=Colletotrichum higginsianum (strain IMI 349063) TaxID=759273 RepID=A0A1B7YUM7_COLHI|nr:hypothetical protein CH63R_00842 [Colletotrichum higginsianum IMI 349063]OBR15662.1 hypothetical protein CH63R_00842 [Colletotrichum higginsianum IMI 349063]